MKIRIFNEVRDPEGERIAYEEQLLTEAVENIIPPSMTVLISAIKDKVFPNKAHEDILAKYVAAYFPVNDGSGKHFNVQLMNNIFNNAVGGIMLDMRNAHYFTDWLEKEKRAGRKPMGSNPERERLVELVEDFREQFEVGWIYKKNSDGTYLDNDDKYQSAAWTWADKYDEYIKPSGPKVPDEDEFVHDDPTDPERALLTIAQAYKAFTKMSKKFFKKNPEFEKVKESFFDKIDDRWKRAQATWWSQRIRMLGKIIKFLKADKNNHNKLQAIWNAHGRLADMDMESGEVLKDSALRAANTYIDDWTISQEWKECVEFKSMPFSKPCVVKKFSNGKFWFNRASAYCAIGADKMANCGKANFDDSTLLMLKAGDLEQGIKWHVMLEWNPQQKTIYQILGFANQFPEREDWEEIKWFWEHMGEPKIDDRFLQHMDREKRITKKQKENFFSFLGYQTDPLKKRPKNWSDVWKRFTNGEYSHENRIRDEWDRDTNRQIFRFNTTTSDTHEYSDAIVRFEFIVRQVFSERIERENIEDAKKILFKQADAMHGMLHSMAADISKRSAGDVPPDEVVKPRGVTANIMREPGGPQVALLRFMYTAQPAIWQYKDEITGRAKNMPYSAHNWVIAMRQQFRPNVLLQTGKDVIKATEEEMEKLQKPKDAPKPKAMVAPSGVAGGETDWSQDQMVTRWKVDREEGAQSRRRWQQLRGSARRRMMLLIDMKAGEDEHPYDKLDALGHAELNVLVDYFYEVLPSDYKDLLEELLNNEEFVAGHFGDDGGFTPDADENLQEARNIVREILAEKKSGVRIRITEGVSGDVTTEEERFLMSLEEVFPDFDLRDESVVRHLVKTIESSSDPEEVLDKLDLNNYTGVVGDHEIHARMGAIFRLMSSHWFTPVETLNEAKDPPWFLSYKGGKPPIGDNPKGPYPSGGETADKIGNYKIKVRTRDIMKEPEKPVVPGKEPDMEFVEEKGTFNGAGIIPYRGEGENLEFLIGQSPQGWWDIFKGRIDEGESAEETAKREFEEESSFSYNGSLEADMALTNGKVKAWLVEMPDLDDKAFDVSKISIISTSEKDKKLNKKNPFEGKPEVVAVGWFKRDEAEDKMNRRQRPFIGLAYDKLNKKPLEESKEITKLRIFDFDETIAFTSANTYVETPHREDLVFPDQDSFDEWVKETAAHHGIEEFDPIPDLEKLGYFIDFTEYAKVNNPRLNKKVVDHLWRIVKKNRSEPTRGVYVMTARGPDSKQAIIEYLKEQGFGTNDFADIITLAGASKKDAIAGLVKQNPSVNSIAFWDDSDRNISDVQQLRSMYPEMDIQINHVVGGSPNPVEEGKIIDFIKKQSEAIKTLSDAASKKALMYYIDAMHKVEDQQASAKEFIDEYIPQPMQKAALLAAVAALIVAGKVELAAKLAEGGLSIVDLLEELAGLVTEEKEFLEEALGPIGWHVSNEKNQQSIIENGIRSSAGSTDDLNPDYGEGRVYFFSHGRMDRGLESAKLAMLEGAIVAAEPPYIIVPFNLKKVSGEITPDPELQKLDIFGPDGYYLVGEVPPEAIIASHIKHENEFKKEKTKDLKESKIRVYINKR